MSKRGRGGSAGAKFRISLGLPVGAVINCADNTAVVHEAYKGIFSDDGKFKCYLKCVTVSVGVMNDSGEVVTTDEAMKMLPLDWRNPIKNMLIKCRPALKSADLCERAYELHICAHNVDPEKYVLI